MDKFPNTVNFNKFIIIILYKDVDHNTTFMFIISV